MVITKILFAQKYMTIFLVLQLSILTILLQSCHNSPEPEIDYPDSNLSFDKHIHPIFFNDCASGGNCHQSITPANGLDLETFAPTFIGNSGSVITPEKPNESILYRVLKEPYLGISRMPPGNKGPLQDAKIKAIKTWIEEGARIDN